MTQLHRRSPLWRLLLAVGLAWTLSAPAAHAHGTVRFDGGRWFDGQAFRPATWWSVEGVLRTQHAGEPDRVIHLSGAFVVPPLADAHSHGLASPGFEREAARFLERGVFYVSNPNSVLTWTREARVKGADGAQAPDVRYANGGLTSSGGHPVQIYEGLAKELGWSAERMDGEAYFQLDDAAQLAARWPEILEGHPDLIKVYLEHSEEHAKRRADPAYHGRRGLDPALVPLVVERAHGGRGDAQSRLRVSAHVSTAADLRVAIDAGVDEVAHLPLERIDDSLAEAVARARATVVTTVLSHRDTSGFADPEGALTHNLGLLLAVGAKVVLGTDSDASVIDEAERIFEMGVLDRTALVRMATHDTARWIFPERAIGAFEDGAEASFLALEGDPTVDLANLRKIRLRVQSGHEVEVAEESSKTGIADVLAHALMRDGAEAAIARYRQLRESEPDTYDFSEPQLNRLGYTALQHQRARDAVAIFRLNAELFPGSANVWDSLGDGLSAAGQKEEAATAYRRALEIAPHQQLTREKLLALEGGGPR